MRISFHFPHSLSSNATRHHRRKSLILACAAIAVLPLAWRGASCGHDFDFHLQSWLEVVTHWHEGILYPHWDASANYGAGEPRFVFYPPLSWLVGAILGVLLPWTWTPLAFTLLALIGCGLSFLRMAREWMADDAAAVAACIYLLSPYLLFVAYERTAYGELLAAVFLPLLVLYGLRQTPSLLALSLVIAALWLTNAPSAVMGCYLLVLLIIVSAIGNRSYALIGRAAGATGLGLGLAAFYIVPAIYEQRWVEITRAIAPGMRVEDSFLFGHIGDPFHDKVLHTASWIAIVMLFIAVIAAVFPQRDRRPNPLRVPLIATLIAVCFLLFPFSDVFWQNTPELKFLQFPWRWLLVLGLVMAALIGFNLRGSFLEAKTRRSIVIRSTCMLLLAVGMTSVAAFKFWQVCDDEDNIAAQRATYRESGFEGSDEYTPTNVDNGDIQQDLPPIRVLKSPGADQADSSLAENPEWAGSSPDTQNATTKIRRWQPENKEVEIETQSPAYAVFRLMDYPAWRVSVNHVLVPARPRRDDGLLTVPLASGRSLISIRYMPREDMKLGYVISLLALCITIGIYAQTKRLRNSQLS